MNTQFEKPIISVDKNTHAVHVLKDIRGFYFQPPQIAGFLDHSPDRVIAKAIEIAANL